MSLFQFSASSFSTLFISFIICFGMITEGFPVSYSILSCRQNDCVNVTELSPHLRNANWNLSNLSQYQANNVSLTDNGMILAYDKNTYAGGDELNLSTQPTNDRPSLAVNSNGDYMVSWTKTMSTSENNLFAQFFYSNGTNKGSDVTICGASGGQSNSKVLCDLKNNYLIGWEDWRNMSSNWLYGRQYDPDGNALGTEFPFSGTNSAWSPTFALDSDDNVLIAWVGYENNEAELFLQKFDIHGTPVGNSSNVRTTSEEIDHPILEFNNNNNVILVWTEIKTDGITNHYSTYFEIFDSDGTQLGTLHEFKSNDSDYSSPAIATDSDGNFILAYCHILPYPDDYSEVIVQKYYPNGTEYGNSFQPLRTENQSDPSITIDKDDKIVLAWSETIEYYIGAAYMQRFDKNGTPVGGKTLLYHGDGYVKWSLLNSLPSGKILALWVQNWASAEYVYLRQFQKGAYASDGTLETPDFVVPNLVSWGNFLVNASYMSPSKNSISAFYSTNGGFNWSPVPASMNLSKANASTGKIRFRIELSTIDLRTSPILNSFSLNYTVNKAPIIISLTPDDLTDAYRGELIQFAVIAMDLENDSLTYDWAQTMGPAVYLDGNGTDSASFIPEVLGFYQFKLTLWDGHARSLPAFANISVVDRPPIINIWGDGTPFKKVPYHLHADVTDPDEDTVTWNWSILRSPAGTVFNDTDSLNPTIESPASGNCSIQLSAIDSLGAASNLTYDFAFVGHPPVSALSVNRTQSRPGVYFGFTANASFDPDNDSLSYFFDFGDGNNSGWTEVSNASHQYFAPGHYSATVMVRDTDGNISTPASVDITILPFNIPPAVTFSFTQGNLSVPFQFKGEAVDPDGTIVSLSWDFGDGTNATGANVQHQYKEGGNFTVRLTATDNDDADVTVEKTIRINRPPSILSALPASPMNLKWGQHANLSVTAVDPDGDGLNYLWSVDGQKVVGDGQTYDFSSKISGTLNVTVAVDDGQGETVIHSWIIKVLPKTSESNVVVGPILPPILIVVLVIVIAAALISIVLFRRWKRKETR